MRARTFLRAALATIAVFVAMGTPFVVIHAGNSTLAYTAAQSTQVQTRLIPLFNKAHCARFGLAPGCTSSALTTAGCLTQVVKTVTIESCVVFTQDSVGEQAFLQEQENSRLVELFASLTGSDVQDFCSSWKALTVGQQNAECTVQGLPGGCTPCP